MAQSRRGVRRIDLGAYPIRVERAPNGGIIATVPGLPGCVAAAFDATDLDAALERAIVLYLDDHPDSPAHYRD